MVLFFIGASCYSSFWLKNDSLNDECIEVDTPDSICSQVVLMQDYRMFMFYVRDSIMREVISTSICGFKNNCGEDDGASERLLWNRKINLKDEEIEFLLTGIEEYGEGYYNFLKISDNKYFVNVEHLNYRPNRGSHNSVNINVELHKLELLFESELNENFGIDNKWLEKYQEINICSLLSGEQVNAFFSWKEQIGFEKALKLTKRKIVS